ncbi:melanoma inhibitory activity protein 2 isoform X3 [Acipenser ruthenus]|uniref:melanoma inhibitory activity protein 2 isoform X3 n=1 Tax=Acipenser ruthenus TaxID=7906 RepID=UPI0027406C3B|nr:melanoma inhibitory activity protein 2 isoform X3 [Acipenser ruthenus]
MTCGLAVDAVEIEEVYVSNEVQIPAKETDFFCLDGTGYFTESESSQLESQEPHKSEVPASETGSSVKIGSKTEQNENAGKGEPSDSAEQLGHVNKDLKVAEQEGSHWLGSRVTGWLGLGSQEDNGEQKKAEQLSFKSRKIAMDFNDNAFKSDIEKETEPKKNGWLSGSLSNLMNFRGQAPEVLANNKPENADDKITAQHRKKATMTNTGEAGQTEMEHNSQEEKAAGDGSKSNWLNIGISDVLSFSRNSWNGNSKPKDGTLKEKYDGQVEDDKISSDGEQELNREETSTQTGEQRSIVPNTEKKDSTSHPDKETVEGETNMKGEKTGWYDNVSNNTLGFVREEMSGQREVHFLKDAESTEMALDIQEPDLGEEVKVSTEITDNREEEESQSMLSVGGIQNMYGSLTSRFQQDNSDTKKDLPKEEASVESTEHKKLTESDQDVLDNMHPMENLQEQSMSDSVQVAGLNEMEEMLEGDQGGENEIGIPTANKPGPEHRAELDFPFGSNVGNNVQFLEELGVVKEGTGNHHDFQDVFISDSEDPIKLTGNSNHFSKESDLPKDNDNDIEKEAEHEQIERTIPEHTTKNTILNLSEGSVVGKPSTKSYNYHLNDAGLNKDVFESDTEKHNVLQDKEHAETTVNHNLKETIHSPSESTLFNKESDPLSATDFTKQLQNEDDNQDQLHLVSKQEHYNYANLPGDTAIDGGILEATDTTSSLTLKELTSILVQEEGLIKMNLSIKEGFQSQDQPSIEAQAKLKEDNKKVRKPEDAEEIMKIQHKMLNEEKLSCRESLAHADKSLNHLSIKDMSNEYLPQTHDSKVVPPEEKKHNVKDKDQGIFESTTKHLPELQSLEKLTLDTKDHYESINSDNAQMTPVTQDMLLESSLKPEKTIVIDTDEVILHETSTDHRDGDNDKHSLDSKGLKLDADSEDSSHSSQELVLLAQKLITEQGISPVIESEALSPEQTDTKTHESQPFSQQQTKIIKSESVSAPNQETSVLHVSEESPYVPQEFNRVEERLLLEMKNEQPGTLNFEQNLRTEAKQANGKLASDSPLVEHSSSTEIPLGAVMDKSIYTDKTNTESIKGIAGLHLDLIKKENVVQDLHKLPKTNDVHSETSIGKIENKLTAEKEVQNKLDSLTFKEGVDKTQNNLEAKCGEEDNPVADKKDSGQVEKESGINHVELNSDEPEYSNSFRDEGSLGLQPHDHSTKSTFSLEGEEETSISSTQTVDSLQETKHQDQIHTPVPKATKAFKDLRRMRKYMTAEDIEYLIHAFGYRKLLWLDYCLDNTEAELSSQNDEDILTLISDFEHSLKHQRIISAAKKSSVQENIKGDRLHDNNMALQKLEDLLSTLKSRYTAKTSVRIEDQDKYILGCTTDTCIQAEKTEEKNSDQGAKITEGTKEDSTLSSVMVRSNKGDEKSISTIGLPKGITDTTRTMQTETEWPSESVQEGKDKTLSRNTTSQIILQLKEDASSQNDKTEGVSVVGKALHALYEASSLLRPLWPRVQHFAKTAVSLLPEDMRPGPDMYGLPWEVVIVTAFVGILSALLFLCRFWQSIKSRLYVGREKKLATKVAELLEEKCKVLETLSECKQQYEKLDATLKNGGHSKQASEKENLQVMSVKLENSNSELKEEIDQLKQDLDSQRTTRAQQDELLAEMQRSLKSLEEEAIGLKSQMEQAQTTLKIYQINSERLQTNLQAAKEENCQLQESKAQLVQEAEGWDERLNELAEQIKMCEESQKDMQEDCSNKDEQIKTLTDCLLKMKDWDSELEDDQTTQTENGEYLDHQKEQIQNLIYAVKMHAGLKSIEEDKNRIFTKLADEEKAKEDLKERIEKLKNDKDVLHSESMKYTREAEKLQQKLKIMTEMYQENELKLHRKLTVEEKERTQKEEKLTKADEKIILAAEELSSYRQRAKDLEEERERTNQAYKNQIASHEKKAHDNWLAARAAERDLNEIKRENSHLRQRLTDSQFKLEMVEKDPYALDVPGRPQFRGERSPFGPSPLGRPASETRAFLSPPTLMDGPPRVSPAFPGVLGGRASRGPPNHAAHPVLSESLDPNCDRNFDNYSTHSDSGSLSPTWERERRVHVPPPGYPYPDPTFPYRRPPPERGYPMPPLSGRLSGPAEIRGYSPLSADGSYLLNSLDNSGAAGNENKDSLLPMSGDLPLPSDAELRMDPGFGPPVMRGPLLPMDARGHFPRRGPYGPSEFFPPRGPSGPLLCMRGPPPPGMFPRFPPPQLHPGYPPARYPTESASEPPPRPSPPTSEQPGEHAAPQPPQDII